MPSKYAWTSPRKTNVSSNNATEQCVRPPNLQRATVIWLRFNKHTANTNTKLSFSVSQINDKQPSLKRAVCVQERFFILLRFQQPFVSDGWEKAKSTNTFVICKKKEKKKKRGMVTSRMGRKRESLWRPFILDRVWIISRNQRKSLTVSNNFVSLLLLKPTVASYYNQ